MESSVSLENMKTDNHFIVPAGTLVAVGGNEDKHYDKLVLRKIVELSGKPSPKIAVITTASSIPEVLGKRYTRAFKKIGVSTVDLLHITNRREADGEEQVRRVRDADIVFFTGGDQLRITGILGGSAVLREVKHRYMSDDIIIAGTSAGAAAMSDTMIYGGESKEALCKGVVQMTAGVGFVKGVILDSHFIKRGRFSRLMEVITSNPGFIGVGLGEDTGVVIRDGHVLEAIGTGLVVIFDGVQIKYSNVYDIKAREAIAVEHVIVHTIVKGHGYDILTRRYLTPSDMQAKKNLASEDR